LTRLIKETGRKWDINIPLQEEYQENGKIGDVVHVSFLIQDWDKAGNLLFPGFNDVQNFRLP